MERMTGKERLLTALSNQKPDRLPCQVHSWMQYYLNTYLNGATQYEAYEYFEMDPVIYMATCFIYDEKDLANWTAEYKDLGLLEDGYWHWEQCITTPKGKLYNKGANNHLRLLRKKMGQC